MVREKGEGVTTLNIKKQTFLSLILSFFSFVINYSVNFLVTPYISAHLPGTYGYVKLANDIIGYAQLITIALDSMASRFISIEYNKGNKERAHQYYCSVMAANIIIAAVLSVPMSLAVLNIESLISIPEANLMDIKILFALSFFSFLLTICFAANSVATFVLNRLDLTYYVEIIIYVVRAGVLLLLFALMAPHVYYIGLTGVFVGVITIVGNQVIKVKILPKFRFEPNMVSFRMVWEIVSAGIWNTVQKLGQILLDGLDLIISNIMINAAAMNDLSFAKTMPTIIASLLVKVSSVFMPNYAILYAQGQMEELKKATKSSMTILSVIISIPIGIIIAFGLDFYQLWIPNENVRMVTILSTLSCILYVVSTPMNAVYNLFTVANKVKPLALVMLMSGILSTLLVLMLVKLTTAGIFAVVCCSVVIGILRNVIFVAPYAAKMLGFSAFTFFPEIGKSIISVVVVSVMSVILRMLMPITGWSTFFVLCIIAAGLGLIINIIFLLDKEQKSKLVHKLWGRME